MADTLTHRRVVTIAGPIVISNATVPILGLVDAGVVGQLGEAAPLAAVGLGALFLTAFYWIFGFLRMGTTGFASQARGQGDDAELAVILSRALGIAVVAGVAIIALQLPLFWLAFWISPATPEVEGLARSYMGIRVWSAPALIALYAVTGWLIAAERTTAVLVIQLWMNGLNIVLDFVFVLGFGWGVNGVAIATFLAEWTGVALGLWYCRAAFVGDSWRDWARITDPAKLKRFAQVNSDIMIRSLLLQAMFMSFVLYSAKFGEARQAATHILLLFLEVTAYAMDGFAFAAEVLVGKAMGARQRSAFRRAAVMTSLWGLGVGVVLALGFGLFGATVIDVMTTSDEVRREARVYLGYMIAAPILGAAAWMLDGIFIGATRTKDMRDMMAVSAALYFVAALALMPIFGLHGLWIAFLFGFALRGATLGWKYPALEQSAGTMD